MARQQKSMELEVCEPVESRKSLFERVAIHLDVNDWNHTAYQDKGYFSMGARLRDASIRLIIDVAEKENWDRVLVYSIYPNYVPEHRRAAMLQAINRINYTLAFGSLEMDLKDGEVRVRTVVEGVGTLGDVMIERVLGSNLGTTNRFQAALLAVAFGNASPDTVIELADRGEEVTLQ